MAENDNDLVLRYRRGDVEALAELVEKYRRPLFSFILNMTEGRGDADEVFQDVWLKAIRKLHKYKHKNLFGWLVRIAHNTVIDKARKRKPDTSIDAESGDGWTLGDTLAAREAGPREQVEAGDLSRRIAQAVRTLPAEQKEVFLMRVQAELSFKEIAHIQRVSINTALARMQYALTKLRPLLKDDYDSLGR